MLINTNNFSDISNFINSLSYVDFEKIVKEYSIVNNINYDMTLNKMITVNLEERLNKLEINKTCPSLTKVKNGKRSNGIQEYKCKECKTKFTAFTDTILEKSHFHWDIWVKILELTINNYSVEKIVNILQNDYKCSNINSKTIWHMRLKLIHSIASLPVPTLTGVIQIDETFVRESQKGSKNLISYIKNEERLPRYGKIPSKYGITGSEFATITTAIDNRGYSICEVSGLGRLKEDIFYELFNEKIDYPTFICTDGNNVYSKYSELLNIPENALFLCGLSIGVKDEELSTEKVKPRLPDAANVGYNEFPKSNVEVLKEYRQTMVDFAEARETKTWTKKFADFYAQPSGIEKVTKVLLEKNGFVSEKE